MKEHFPRRTNMNSIRTHARTQTHHTHNELIGKLIRTHITLALIKTHTQQTQLEVTGAFVAPCMDLFIY